MLFFVIFTLFITAMTAIAALIYNNPAVGAVSAAFAALSGMFITLLLQEKRFQEQQSLFYLNSYTDGVEQASMLLGDGNNDRVTWLAAARILARCREIEPMITESGHKNWLKIRKDEYRQRFGYILGVGNPNATLAFFYGVDPSISSTTEAAAASSKRGHDHTTHLRQLDEGSIHEIWKFADFPDDYDDPIETRFSSDELEKLKFGFHGLYTFLQHKDAFSTSGGEVRERTKKRKRR